MVWIRHFRDIIDKCAYMPRSPSLSWHTQSLAKPVELYYNRHMKIKISYPGQVAYIVDALESIER